MKGKRNEERAGVDGMRARGMKNKHCLTKDNFNLILLISGKENVFYFLKAKSAKMETTY